MASGQTSDESEDGEAGPPSLQDQIDDVMLSSDAAAIRPVVFAADAAGISHPSLTALRQKLEALEILVAAPPTSDNSTGQIGLDFSAAELAAEEPPAGGGGSSSSEPDLSRSGSSGSAEARAEDAAAAETETQDEGDGSLEARPVRRLIL